MSDRHTVETSDGDRHSGERTSVTGDGGHASCLVDQVLFGGSQGHGGHTTVRDDKGDYWTGKDQGKSRK